MTEDATCARIRKMGMRPNVPSLDGMWLEYNSLEAKVFIWADAWITSW